MAQYWVVLKPGPLDRMLGFASGSKVAALALLLTAHLTPQEEPWA